MKLLIVDDNWLAAAGMQDMAEEAGHEVLGVVASVDSFFQAVDAPPPERGPLPDCVLLDVRLAHNQTSEPIAAYLREHRVPFLWTTGWMEKAAGAEPVLLKPVSYDTLAGALAAIQAAA